jgi:transcriptional regulator with XRE-family HTH domain
MCHKLKDVREANDLSVADLAVLSEISPCTIYRIESGDTTYKVNIGTAEALAYALDVPVEQLFTSLELSHIGRPPHTGKPIGVHIEEDEDICPGCFIKRPVSGVCDTCGSVVVPLRAVG